MNSIKFFLLAFGFSVVAQNSVQFKSKILPEKSYNMSTTMEMVGTMDFSGSQEVMDKMKSEGMELPLKMKMSSESKMTSTSGKLQEDKSLPVVIEITSITKDIEIGGKKQEAKPDPTLGLKLYCTQRDTSMSIDSIGGTNLPEEYKSMFSGIVSSMKDAFKGFPNRPIKVGEKVKVSLPIAIPMPMVGNMNMKNDMEYKLVKIEKGIAYLEYTFKMDIDLEKNSKEFSFSGGGSGKGTMQYHIADKVMFSSFSNMKMDMKIGVKDMIMTMVSDAVTKQTIAVK